MVKDKHAPPQQVKLLSRAEHNAVHSMRDGLKMPCELATLLTQIMDRLLPLTKGTQSDIPEVRNEAHFMSGQRNMTAMIRRYVEHNDKVSLDVLAGKGRTK